MRLFVARHAETVHNAARRMQGNHAHTPLTGIGLGQAECMGKTLLAFLGPNPPIRIWSSPAGRALQTAAIVAGHLGHDYFDIRIDPRLREIEVGDWAGRLYSDIVAEGGAILCPEHRAFLVRPPGGETYPEVAARLSEWLDALEEDGDILVVTHGMTSRVLRGLLAGGTPFGGVTLADGVSQSRIALVEGGREALLPAD